METNHKQMLAYSIRLSCCQQIHQVAPLRNSFRTIEPAWILKTFKANKGDKFTAMTKLSFRE